MASQLRVGVLTAAFQVCLSVRRGSEWEPGVALAQGQGLGGGGLSCP